MLLAMALKRPNFYQPWKVKVTEREKVIVIEREKVIVTEIEIVIKRHTKRESVSERTSFREIGLERERERA